MLLEQIVNSLFTVRSWEVFVDLAYSLDREDPEVTSRLARLFDSDILDLVVQLVSDVIEQYTDNLGSVST